MITCALLIGTRYLHRIIIHYNKPEQEEKSEQDSSTMCRRDTAQNIILFEKHIL